MSSDSITLENAAAETADPGAAQTVLRELEHGPNGAAGDRTIDEILTERAGPGLVAEQEQPPPSGIDVLAELAGATDDEKSAESSYGYDRELAENGKWFRFPKLGKNARVYLHKVGCTAWKRLIERARERYGNEEGRIEPKTMEKIIDPMIAKSLWTRMEGVQIKLTEPPLEDTLENRLRVLEMFHPDAGNDLFKVCNSPKQFRDASEEILGN